MNRLAAVSTIAGWLVVFLLVAPASGQILPPGVQVLRNLQYSNRSPSNVLDLYLPPKSKTPCPLVIWVHGGGWEGGNKVAWPAIFLIDKGYAVATIHYRLSDEAKFPAQIVDCKAAIRFLRANIKPRRWNIDPDRFGAWGDSAGGHLVALLGATNGLPEFEGTASKKTLTISSRVQAVCDWFGPTDLAKFTEFQAKFGKLPPNYPELAVAKLLGGPLRTKRDLARLANPITFVTEKAPPFLIMHGDRDTLVPLEQSQLLESALRKAGGNVELYVVPGKGHEPLDDPTVLAKVEAFFDKTIGLNEKKLKDAKLIATYQHRAGGGAPMTIDFYSNGRVLTSNGPHTWRRNGDRLVLCWYRAPARPDGVWIDVCEVSRDGSAYRGVNQGGVAIQGERTSGDLRAGDQP